MITMLVRDGKAIKPDDCPKEYYDPPVGTIIKFILEDGNEYHVVSCDDSNAYCYDCVFDSNTGHPLSKLFNGECGPETTQMYCYDRIYKPIDDILENL